MGLKRSLGGFIVVREEYDKSEEGCCGLILMWDRDKELWRNEVGNEFVGDVGCMGVGVGDGGGYKLLADGRQDLRWMIDVNFCCMVLYGQARNGWEVKEGLIG